MRGSLIAISVNILNFLCHPENPQPTIHEMETTLQPASTILFKIMIGMEKNVQLYNLTCFLWLDGECLQSMMKLLQQSKHLEHYLEQYKSVYCTLKEGLDVALGCSNGIISILLCCNHLSCFHTSDWTTISDIRKVCLLPSICVDPFWKSSRISLSLHITWPLLLTSCMFVSSLFI